VHSAGDPVGFVHELFQQYGESVEDLEVSRAGLEETYMALVRQFESGHGQGAERKFGVVTS
jgi:ABC-2 type transport system ATP-binding protein